MVQLKHQRALAGTCDTMHNSTHHNTLGQCRCCHHKSTCSTLTIVKTKDALLCK
jgi:hypothetical protein